MFDGLESEAAAVVSEDSEVHLESPVVDLKLVVTAVLEGSQVGGAQLAARERAPSDLEVLPETRRAEHVEPVTADARARVAVGQRQHRVDLFQHEDRCVRPHDTDLIANRTPRKLLRDVSVGSSET